MGNLSVIGGLIGELADRVLDWLEDRSDKETEGIEEHPPPPREEGGETQ